MIEIRQTDVYSRWFDGLRDRQARNLEAFSKTLS
jgi:putative component of toxin-antitoxin plasmid stabilization module